MMSLDEPFEAIDELSEVDLENLVDRALLVRARRKAPVLTAKETELLLEINQGIATELGDRYQVLLKKRDDETLGETEYAELLEISNQIEGFGVRRVEALSKLAAIRQVPLLKLMDDLGIQNPGVR
ncbi:MAG: STAS/SEC14 domain-containing protein [Oculatellaceae cyanobacterium Prado106]|jgi:hypothetical protein|nr:STAS/SEC14 domain-containing protein [Oculatellaceae cyanobacterium Prado106]